MNLDGIQERLPDIEKMRAVSAENETNLRLNHGRERAGEDTVTPVSSLTFRLYLAVILLGLFIYADYKELPVGPYTTGQLEQTLSYQVTLDDIKNFWYTDGMEIMETWAQNFESMFQGK